MSAPQPVDATDARAPENDTSPAPRAALDLRIVKAVAMASGVTDATVRYQREGRSVRAILECRADPRVVPSRPSYGDDETEAARHLLGALVRELEHMATIREGAAAMYRRDAAIADADATNARAAALFAGDPA